MAAFDVNWAAVLVAGLVSMAVGFFWYSPKVFGMQWMKLAGLNQKKLEQEGKKNMSRNMVLAFLGTLVTAYVLSMILDFAQAGTAMQGAITGFWVWLGFVTTTQIGSFLWESKPSQLYFLNTAYSFVNLVVMGVILAAWP